MNVIRTSIFIIIIAVFGPALAQQPVIYLHYWRKPTKIVKITNAVDLEISLKARDSAGTNEKNSYNGILTCVFDDHMLVKVSEKRSQIKMADGNHVQTEIIYTPSDTAYKGYIKVDSEAADKRRRMTAMQGMPDSNMCHVNIGQQIISITYSDIESISYVQISRTFRRNC